MDRRVTPVSSLNAANMALGVGLLGRAVSPDGGGCWDPGPRIFGFWMRYAAGSDFSHIT